MARRHKPGSKVPKIRKPGKRYRPAIAKAKGLFRGKCTDVAKLTFKTGHKKGSTFEINGMINVHTLKGLIDDGHDLYG